MGSGEGSMGGIGRMGRGMEGWEGDGRMAESQTTLRRGLVKAETKKEVYFRLVMLTMSIECQR
jgi:hypothetical protein